ncbi:MAG: RDD family protein [Candidatus Dormibacteraeota bacterium]|nr:RDD family protein [Candidatus Dormibacteraeota bacterium]
MPGGAYPPQAYAPQVRYGGFWIRVVAYIIDFIILGVVGGIVDVILHANPSDPNSSGYALANLINFVIDIAYFVGLWTYWGASVGQRIFKLRIVDANTQQPIGVGKAALRWLGLVVSFLVCFVGVIWVAFDARKQGWMDKIAGTLVVQG